MFSSFMNPVAIYVVGYFFSRLVFVVVLPDVMWGNNICNTWSQISFSFELIDSSLAKSQIHYHRRIFFLVQWLMREFVHLIAVECKLKVREDFLVLKYFLVLGRIAAVFLHFLINNQI